MPAYVNVWLREQKNFMRPGEAYPSGGGTLNVLDIWKAMTPSLDAVAPDNYVLDYQNYVRVLAGYRRKDNPLLVPETANPDALAILVRVIVVKDSGDAARKVGGIRDLNNNAVIRTPVRHRSATA